MRKLLQSLPLLLTLAVPPAVSNEATAPPPSAGGDFAEVQKGDSLSSFLERNGVSKEELKMFNPGLQLNGLKVGNEMRINSNCVLTPAEQSVLNRLKANQNHKKEKERQAWNADKKRWGKCFDIYQYDWQSWKKAANGTWVSDRRLCEFRSDISLKLPARFSHLASKTSIAVTCKGLKISTLHSHHVDGWSEWKDPSGGETEMLVKLCSREEL